MCQTADPMILSLNTRSFALLIGLVLTCAGSFPVYAGDSFPQWLEGLRLEAITQGISAQTVDRALTGVSLDPAVIGYDRHQPEKVLTLDAYLARTLPDRRVTKGRQMLVEHRVLLRRLYGQYGVEPEVLVALWAIETEFGRHIGKMDTLRSLVTLAFDQRRRSYFTGELLAALEVVDQGLIESGDMRGSWAGAMGQFQFMPSVLKQYAVDDDGDGHVEIFKMSPDVFASAANYLSRLGWQRGLRWGAESQSSDDSTGKIVAPDGPTGRSFVVSDNFERLLTWNRSDKYAIAVGLLSDQLAMQKGAQGLESAIFQPE